MRLRCSDAFLRGFISRKQPCKRQFCNLGNSKAALRWNKTVLDPLLHGLRAYIDFLCQISLDTAYTVYGLLCDVGHTFLQIRSNVQDYL
ncbi:hypothetical protein A9J41_11465 [Laribacter hongkongensis]|nr:hypothetical protein [Laribacter hongkongensis]